VLGGAVFSANTRNLINVDRSSTAAFTATDETLTGNFVTDSTSTINASLRTNTTLTGAVNHSSPWPREPMIPSARAGRPEYRDARDGLLTFHVRI
jgi:hypothetical protein